MKKLLTSLLTFTIGITAFDLLKMKQVSTSTIVTPEQKVIEISALQTESISSRITQTKKNENLKPFFDSFKSDVYDNEGIYQGYSGWFAADDFRGMSEVWTILLNRDNENSKDEKLVWSAMILTQNVDGSPNDDDIFQSVWIKTENNRLSFRTNKIRGTEYKFDGKFFKNGKDFSDNEKVLTGTLRKIVKGKEVAGFAANFAYHEPVCFH